MKEQGLPLLPASVKAEAAVWLARLHADDRDRRDEIGLQAWLAADESHRSAFELVTGAWEEAGGAGVERERTAPWWSRRQVVAGGAVAVTAAIGGAVLIVTWPGESYATAVGEQKRIALADGSTVLLDTDTRISVSLGRRSRDIRLERGRAHFAVASDPLRPFIVDAAGRQVVAIGTAFDVSTIEDRLSVVLIEGKVGVGAIEGAARDLRLMRPGDRLTISHGAAGRIDRPAMDMATAWQSGRAVFDNEPLQSAVAQMNRYGRKPIALGDPGLGQVPISGIYATGDTEAFARSVSLLLGAGVTVEADRIVLRRLAAT